MVSGCSSRVEGTVRGKTKIGSGAGDGEVKAEGTAVHRVGRE